MVTAIGMYEEGRDDNVLYLHGNYDTAGLEAFKRDILSSHGNSQRLPVIMGGQPSEKVMSQLPHHVRLTSEQRYKRPETYAHRLVSWFKSFPR
jgi:hypothetical protein